MDLNIDPNVAIEVIVSQQEQVREIRIQKLGALEPSVANKRSVLAQEVEEKLFLSHLQKAKDFKVRESNQSSNNAQLILDQTKDITDELNRTLQEQRALRASDEINYEHQAAEKAKTFLQGPVLFSKLNVSLQMANMRKDREFLEGKIHEETRVLEEQFEHLYERPVITRSDGSAEESDLESFRKDISLLLNIKNEDKEQKMQFESEEQQLEAAIKRKTAVLSVAKQQCP